VDAREGRVEILENDGRKVSARVEQGGQRLRVAIDLGTQRIGHSSCTCRAFTTTGPCEHLWAVLAVSVGGILRAPSDLGGDAAGFRAWLSKLQRVESEVPVESADPDLTASRVEYVLVLDDDLALDSTVLETRRARPSSRGGFGKSSSFALLAPRKDVLLGPDDRRIAALLRGAGSPLFSGTGHTRRDHRYVLDAEQTAALLPLLCATGRLFWSQRGTLSRALTIDDGPAWRPCLRLEGQGDDGALRLIPLLERAGERIDGRDLRGFLAGDHAVLQDRIVPVQLGRGRAWFQLTCRVPPPPFPRGEAPVLLLELARRGIDAEPGPGMEALIEARRPVPHLTLGAPHKEEGAWREVVGVVEFDYGVGRVAATDLRPLLPTGRGVLRRYFGLEQSLIERARELGAKPVATGSLALPLEGLGATVAALGAAGWVVEGEGARWRALGAPRVALKSGVDWFEIEGHFENEIGGEFPALLAALRRGETTVRLDDGSIGIVPEEWIARWRTALVLGEEKDGRLRFRSSQAWFVDLLLSEFVDQESQRLWAAQRERLAGFGKVGPSKEPAGFEGELRPYQREGLGWLEFLERQHLGGCLADDMGLGKTVQVLAWLQARKERGATGATLIVAPKSLTHNWISEARRFTPGLRTLEYVGPDRKRKQDALASHDLVLSTYGSVRLDIDVLSKIHFDAVVLDEAQAIKNESSRTARSVRLLRADHRLALSGTPIENHMGELWSLFEFLNPGMLGRSSRFQSLLVGDPTQPADGQARETVQRAVRPFLLRRTKEEVLRDLPERIEQTVLCDMEPAQEREYRDLRAHFRRTILEKRSDEELRREKLGILEMLLRLRQAACHPALIDPARIDDPCAKFDALLPMLEDVLESGHKALVFSQFTSFLAVLRRRLDGESRAYGYLDGKTSAAQRAAEVARFQEDPEQKLFLISLKAGGTGLNLTAADYVFLLDPWWNPAVEAQAIGRSHRIGQERKVFAYRLVCSGTIEERVLELQARKRELASAILDGDGSLLGDLTREDLEQLLS